MRLEVTRRAELAVRTIAALAGDATLAGNTVTAAAAAPTPMRRLKAAALAETLGTSTGFVAQIVTPLVKQGWVRSVPGPTGGYVLTDRGRDVSVLQIIEAVDGPTETGDCVVEDRPCRPDGGCPLHEAWAAARPVLLATLAATPAVQWAGGSR